MKGYIVSVYESIKDDVALKNYALKAREAVEKYNGKFLVRGGKFSILEGKHEYERNVRIEFPSFEIAKEFYNSEEYQKAKSFRDGKADFNGIVIEGINTE